MSKCVEEQLLCINFCFELRVQTTNLDEREDGIKVNLEEIIYCLDHLTLLLNCIDYICRVHW